LNDVKKDVTQHLKNTNKLFEDLVQNFMAYTNVIWLPLREFISIALADVPD
jgi:hypothetical protein